MKMKLAIVISDFYKDVSRNLLDGAKNKYNNHFNCDSFSTDVDIFNVPGAFEICGVVNRIINSNLKYDAIITYGCIVKGETAHFEYICNAVSLGIKDMSIKQSTKIPILFGVLTTYNYEQAVIRSDIKKMDKGGEVMSAAIDTVCAFNKIK